MHAAPAKATFINDCGATAPRVNPNTRKAAAAAPTNAVRNALSEK